jgi:exopolysaccharide biosynthesis polyprenyl glycosylphosphotransferase
VGEVQIDAGAAQGSIATVDRRLAVVSGPTGRDVIRRRLLAAADVLTALTVALFFAVTYGWTFAFLAVLAVPAWILLAKVCGLYDRDHRVLRHLTSDELLPVVAWTASAAAALVVFLMAVTGETLSVFAVGSCWLTALCAGLVFRSCLRVGWRRLTPPERLLIVGAGPQSVSFRRKLVLFPDMHAVVADEIDSVDEAIQRLNRGTSYDRIVFVDADITQNEIGQLHRRCRQAGVKLSVVPPLHGIFGTAAQLRHVADLPVIECNTWDVSRSTLLLKRVLDVAVASLALILLSPLFVLVALAVLLDSGRPVFFIQTRAGLDGVPFRMIKFRTMVAGAEDLLGDLVQIERLEEPVFKLPNDPRVTRVGSWLRRSSLDELPQLLNVLRGDMSLVGPRPEQLDLVERYQEQHLFRLSVKPGVTGPMQVSGRGDLTFPERLAVEREYIENLSLGRDLKILSLTLSAVLAGRGAH